MESRSLQNDVLFQQHCFNIYQIDENMFDCDFEYKIIFEKKAFFILLGYALQNWTKNGSPAVSNWNGTSEIASVLVDLAF